ncbi:hypothetical protein OEZ86_006275 [Tetradesmus obliquus]|nr:hypothetical protein OEZ86_006275 [Tetradesmus obliquus]
MDSFDVKAMHSLSQLRHLVIDLRGLNYFEELLPVLQGFTQLQHLYLSYADPREAYKIRAVDMEPWDAMQLRMDEQPCAALTASTQLTHLAVKGFLPADAGRHMFPEGRQLPQLHTLCLDYDVLGAVRVFDEESLSCIVAACPALHSLYLADSMGGCGLAELAHASTLRDLCCLGACDTDVSYALVRLTQLQQLALHKPDWLTDTGALELTVLTGLTNLSITGSSRMTVDDRPRCGWQPRTLCLTSQCRPLNVWQQLKQLLTQHSTDGACLRKLLGKQQKAAAQQLLQLQQAQDTIARLQSQLAGGGQQQPA